MEDIRRFQSKKKGRVNDDENDIKSRVVRTDLIIYSEEGTEGKTSRCGWVGRQCLIYGLTRMFMGTICTFVTYHYKLQIVI